MVILFFFGYYSSTSFVIPRLLPLLYARDFSRWRAALLDAFFLFSIDVMLDIHAGDIAS
jgi:hypothetical protein